jgi:hypothetical protein
MRGRVSLIGCGGGMVSFDVEGDRPGLPVLQKSVGGYIEHIPDWDKFDGQDCVAYCNEEGLLGDLPVNELATKLWREYLDSTGAAYSKELATLRGDVIILTGDPEFLE